MLKYSDFVLDIFYNPVHAGTIKGYYGMGRYKDVQQEEDLKIFVVITNDKISDIRYQTSGSIISHVALSVLSEIALNKTIDEAMQISAHDLLKRIAQVPKSKFSCLPSAIECLKLALKNANKRKETMKEFSSDIVTKNFGTTTKITNIKDLQKAEDDAMIVPSIVKQVEQPKQKPFKVETTKEQKETKTVTPAKTEAKKENKIDKKKPAVKKEEVIAPAPKKVVEEKKVKAEKVEKTLKVEKSKQEKPVAKREEPVVVAKPVKPEIKTEKIQSTPTKIEIRVVEEQPATELTPEQEFVASKTKQKSKPKKVSTKPVQKSAPKEEKKEEKTEVPKSSPQTSGYNSIFKLNDKIDSNQPDELADEIDTITAKLTDAISKLNFKFDDDEIN